MPYYHCSKCHHEFEYIPVADEKITCDWCGAGDPTILEDQTPLEKLGDNWEPLLERLNNGSISKR